MNLVQSSFAVLNNAKFFLQKISTTQYNQAIEVMSGATIGQHSRHFIEFYQCLLQQAPSRNINYCLRKRDLSIEANPMIAIDMIEQILSDLETLDLDIPIILHTAKEAGLSIPSTIGRELHYNIEHCIHHLALIKVGIKIVAPSIQLPEHFGVAPSTLQHRKNLT